MTKRKKIHHQHLCCLVLLISVYWCILVVFSPKKIVDVNCDKCTQTSIALAKSYFLTVRMALIQPYRYRPRHQIWLFLLQASNLVPKRGSWWFLTSSTTHCHMSVFTAYLAHFPIFGLFSLIKSTFLDPKLMDIYK